MEAVMTTQVVTATPATPFPELVELLGQRRIPVIAWEIRHEVLRDRFGEPAAGVTVEVHDGTVTLTAGSSGAARSPRWSAPCRPSPGSPP